MSQRVRIVVDTKGGTKIDMEGFHGVGCAELAAKLTAGALVFGEETKPEFYETPFNENTVSQL